MDTEDKVLVGYDIAGEMQKFHETKSGVKGLVDSGIVSIPQMFVHPTEDLPKDTGITGNCLDIPVIDLQGVDSERRKSIVEEIRIASESCGFFQMVNHGVPCSVLDEIIQGVRKFHEQPVEEKQRIYSPRPSQKVRFNSFGEVYIQAVDWRDSLTCTFREDGLDPEGLPTICREIIIEYLKNVITLRDTLSELLSEALGLSSDYLKRLECMEYITWSGHYSPPCPDPNKTLATTAHTDPYFLTILLQDQTGGLQVFYQNQWVDVAPKKGALIANVGDLLQLITNDRFKSISHRVLARSTCPRISVATFFYPNSFESKYGPVKELLSIENLPKYGETSVKDFFAFYRTKGPAGKENLAHLKL